MEDEVMVALMIKKGTAVKYDNWISQAIPNLASFSIPKYLRVMRSFPKTNTGKIQKHILKKQGVTSNTWKNNK